MTGFNMRDFLRQKKSEQEAPNTLKGSMERLSEIKKNIEGIKKPKDADEFLDEIDNIIQRLLSRLPKGLTPVTPGISLQEDEGVMQWRTIRSNLDTIFSNPYINRLIDTDPSKGDLWKKYTGLRIRIVCKVDLCS